MALSRVSFAMLYDYLRSLFHVWKLIPFEATLRGSALLHYLTSTPSILAPSRGVMFYCCVVLWIRLFNVCWKVHWLDLDLNLCLMMTNGSFCFFFFFFFAPPTPPPTPLSGTAALTTDCRTGSALDSWSCCFPLVCLSLLFGILEGGWVFPLLRASLSNTTSIS